MLYDFFELSRKACFTSEGYMELSIWSQLSLLTWSEERGYALVTTCRTPGNSPLTRHPRTDAQAVTTVPLCGQNEFNSRMHKILLHHTVHVCSTSLKALHKREK